MVDEEKTERQEPSFLEKIDADLQNAVTVFQRAQILCLVPDGIEPVTPAATLLQDTQDYVDGAIVLMRAMYGANAIDLTQYKTAVLLKDRIACALTDRKTAEGFIGLAAVIDRANNTEEQLDVLADTNQGLVRRLGEGFVGEARDRHYVPESEVPGLADGQGYVLPGTGQFDTAARGQGYVPQGTVPAGYVKESDVPSIAQRQHRMVSVDTYNQVVERRSELTAENTALQNKYNLALARARNAEAKLKGKGAKVTAKKR